MMTRCASDGDRARGSRSVATSALGAERFLSRQDRHLVVSASAAAATTSWAARSPSTWESTYRANPRVIVSNMPGAGGLTAMNYLYRNRRRTAASSRAVQNNLPFEPLLGTKEAITIRRNSLAGLAQRRVGLVVVWRTVPVDFVARFEEREITVGSSGANSRRASMPA